MNNTLLIDLLDARIIKDIFISFVFKYISHTKIFKMDKYKGVI